MSAVEQRFINTKEGYIDTQTGENIPYKNLARVQEILTEEEKDKKQREEDKKDKNFVKLFKDNMDEFLWLARKHPIASSIFIFFMEHMDYQNAIVCSQQVLIDYFEVSRQTVSKNVKTLYDNGFIDILKSGNTNVYILNHNIVWSSFANQKIYSKFNGKILISKKENEKEVEVQENRFKQLQVKVKKEKEKKNNKIGGF